MPYLNNFGSISMSKLETFPFGFSWAGPDLPHREPAPTAALVQPRVGTLLPCAKLLVAAKSGTRVGKECFKPVASLTIITGHVVLLHQVPDIRHCAEFDIHQFIGCTYFEIGFSQFKT